MAGRPYSVPSTGKQYSDIPASVIKEATRKNIRPDVLWKKKLKEFRLKQSLDPVVKGAKTVGRNVLKKVIPGTAILDYLRGSPAGAGSDVVSVDSDTKKRGGKVKRKRKKKKSKTKKIMQGYKAGGKV